MIKLILFIKKAKIQHCEHSKVIAIGLINFELFVYFKFLNFNYYFLLNLDAILIIILYFLILIKLNFIDIIIYPHKFITKKSLNFFLIIVYFIMLIVVEEITTKFNFFLFVIVNFMI